MTDAATVARGRKVYNQRCYFCHGYSGDAKTLASTYLSPPPRDFTSADPAKLTRAKMIAAVTHGRKDTAMQSFAGLLSPEDIAAVVDFVRHNFMAGKVGGNTHYHTAANGWPDHKRRYGAAYPFALGKIPLNTPWDKLTPQQREGKRLFMSGCITCHDRARVRDPGAIWDPRAVSYPRGGYRPDQSGTDATSGATPYARHGIAPTFKNLSPQQREGERLFQKNCAFCHAADGTAGNWIGHFLQPHPRNLTDTKVMAGMTRARLKRVIRDGVENTTMSAWKTVLSDEQIDAVIAYITRAFYRPGGKAVSKRRH
jgi:cytochrome c oxidase cbb3-type subunit 3